jgi:hypothetical protein
VELTLALPFESGDFDLLADLEISSGLLVSGKFESVY